MKKIFFILFLFLCLIGKGQTIVGSETFESESVGLYEESDYNFEWFAVQNNIPQYIIDEGGDHGKVLMVPHLTTYNQDDHTMQLQLSLTGQQADELYLAFDYKVDPGWTSLVEQYKFLAGFSGGAWYAIQNNHDTATDGWITSMLMKSSWIQSFCYDSDCDAYSPHYTEFSTSDIDIDSLNNGWVRITIRIKLNTYGVADDFMEFGLNGRWFDRTDGMYFRSWNNQETNYIDYVNIWFFKSPSGSYPTQNDTVYYDNFTSYYLKPGDTDYVADTVTIGSNYSEVKASYDLYPASIIPDSTYNKVTDTIYATRHGAVSPAYKTQNTIIYSAEASYIDITFDDYSLYNKNWPDPGWIKVYKGYGASKILNSTYNNITAPSGTTRIYDSVVTIEYYTAKHRANGFTVYYTSDGVGGGDLPNSSPDTLWTTDDAYTRGGIYGDVNYGSETEMQIRYNNSGGNSDYDEFGHMLFNRSTITDSIIIATLNIYVNSIAEEGTYILRKEGTNWDESAITNDNKPSITSTIDTVTYSGSGWQQIDVTNYLQDSAIGNLISFEMWGLGGTSPYPILYLSSKEGSNDPFIELDLYDEIPPTGGPQDTVLLTDTLFAVQIDSFYLNNCQLQIVNGDTCLGYLDSADWARINNVDFTGCTNSLIIRNIVHPDYRGDSLYLYIDSIVESSKIVAYVPASTGGWETFGFEIIELDSVPIGIHDLYIYSEQFAAGSIHWIAPYYPSEGPESNQINVLNVNNKKKIIQDPQTGILYELKLIFQ